MGIDKRTLGNSVERLPDSAAPASQLPRLSERRRGLDEVLEIEAEA
jgi:hypothetical protein